MDPQDPREILSSKMSSLDYQKVACQATQETEQGRDSTRWTENWLDEDTGTGTEEDGDVQKCGSCLQPTDSILKCRNSHLLCLRCVEMQAKSSPEKAIECSVFGCQAVLSTRRLKFYKHRPVIGVFFRTAKALSAPKNENEQEAAHEIASYHSQEMASDQSQEMVSDQSQEIVLDKSQVVVSDQSVVTISDQSPVNVSDQSPVNVSDESQVNVSDQSQKIDSDQSQEILASPSVLYRDHGVLGQEILYLVNRQNLVIPQSLNFDSESETEVSTSRPAALVKSLDFAESQLLRALYSKSSSSRITDMVKIMNPLCQGPFYRLAHDEEENLNIYYMSARNPAWLDAAIRDGIHVCPEDRRCPCVSGVTCSPEAALVETTGEPVVLTIRLPDTPTLEEPFLEITEEESTHLIDLNYCPLYLITTTPSIFMGVQGRTN